MFSSIKELAAEIELTILKATGSKVEWTFRTDTDFTICGEEQDVKKATEYIVKNKLAKLEQIDHDEVLNESFAYLHK
ncbi:hypothetical protein [Chromobacterium violaceum]|uniref:hypothetical protein n=1 Tax=Chromobacterium violaceum TaxID=536 RepID=UPI001CE05B8A|nr:hypothetical protein [Chromobacterium violaceum]